MLEKIGLFLYKFSMERKMKKKKNREVTEQEKKRKQFHHHFIQLKDFVKWLNEKGFSNRSQRKLFWKSLEKGNPVMENILNNLIKRYAPKKEEDNGKNKKENR